MPNVNQPDFDELRDQVADFSARRGGAPPLGAASGCSSAPEETRRYWDGKPGDRRAGGCVVSSGCIAHRHGCVARRSRLRPVPPRGAGRRLTDERAPDESDRPRVEQQLNAGDNMASRISSGCRPS